jgi:RNA polymerase sigma factor (TIGR02999 family)
MSRSQRDVSELLELWRAGNAQALDELFPLVYEELRKLAASRLRRERHAGTLQTTALVHEAYLRLAGKARAQVRDRAHFFAVAAQAMRRILIDRARRRRASKRDAGPALAAHPFEPQAAASDE